MTTPGPSPRSSSDPVLGSGAGGPLPAPSPWVDYGGYVGWPEGVTVGQPYGGNMGIGTINCQEIYVNGYPVGGGAASSGLWGVFNASNGTIQWSKQSGQSGNTLPPAQSSFDSKYIICQTVGLVPPPGAPAGAYSAGDWLICTGSAWVHLPLDLATVLADSVSVSPPVMGQSNVQLALQSIANGYIPITAYATNAQIDALNPANNLVISPAGLRYIINGQLVNLATTNQTGIIPAINELKGNISALSTGSQMWGIFDASAGTISWNTSSGQSGNTLPTPVPAMQGVYLVCQTGGAVPPGGAPARTYAPGDWLICDGTAWHYIAIGVTTITANSVTVSPTVLGAANVQAALTALNSADGNYLLLSGGTMTGTLTVPDIVTVIDAGTY